MTKPHIVILGAGPAGLGAAFQLTRRSLAQVTVLEEGRRVGGTAGSFDLAGLRVDYGSHRLHPACPPEILRDIRGLLGADLLDRPRHGRIRLRGRWIHFPLKPSELILRLPPSFTLGVAVDGMDAAMRLRPRSSIGEEETFASILETGLGRTISRDFYFPYVRKLWGLEPEALSAVQARRRVSANSWGGVTRKVLSALPGRRNPGNSRFFYPRHGFGQISEAFCQAACEGGARVRLNASLRAVEISRNGSHTVHYEEAGRTQSLQADQVWSTIPITTLIKCLRPRPPVQYLRAAAAIDYRPMVLIYLLLEQDQFSEYDAHYFPEPDIPITRLSEPKNYCDGEGPPDHTILCAELPCDRDDLVRGKSDHELGQLVCDALDAVGIPVQAPVRRVVTRHIRYAYPIYRRGYEVHFDRLDRWINQIDGLLTFGRQGLFAHDNTHHALNMGYSAAACLDENGGFDHTRWRAVRDVFEAHVVED